MSAVCDDIRYECQCANLSFDGHTNKHDGKQLIADWRIAFARSTICGKDYSPTVTLCARTAFALLMCGVFIWSWADYLGERPDGSDSDNNPEASYSAGYWWIYLTKWTLTLQCIYHVLAMLIAIQGRSQLSGCCLNTSQGVTIPTLAKVVWLLQAVCLPATFVVFVLYWCVAADYIVVAFAL
eukprot:COSAG05_NODE_794_length_7287_cov_45.558431_8_plen_182_part_00